jgi:hypothetical protein
MSSEIKIISASYENFDVSDRVKALARGGTLFIASNAYNGHFGDPKPNVLKTFKVKYIKNNHILEKVFMENENCSIV